MKYEVEVKINNLNKLLKDHGLDEKGKVTEFFRGEVDRFCDAYIPYANGGLKINKRYPDEATIEYVSPYAHYMYKGELMLAKNGSSWARKGEKKYYTGKSLKYQGAPKRGAYWDKRMINDRSEEIKQNIERFIRNGGK